MLGSTHTHTHTHKLTSVGPHSACGVEVGGDVLRVIPGADWGLPWWRGAVGSWRCHPGSIVFSDREVY